MLYESFVGYLNCFIIEFLQKLDRIKATDKFSFPLVLPANALIGTDDSTLYDLQAILIHKGGSALHGHYGEFHVYRDSKPGTA